MAMQRADLALVLCRFSRVGAVLFLHWVAMSSMAHAQVFEKSASAPSQVTQADGNFSDGELAEGVKQVGWPNIQLPKITLPKITMPTITLPKLPALWPSQADGDSPALLSPFIAGFSKLSAGTKNAWEGTKDMFNVFQRKGSAGGATRASSNSGPSLWQRLTTRSPKEPDVPQTVGEFMSQARPKP